MKHCRHSKIIATVGPSTDNQESIEKLYRNGVNIFRLNFSHGSHENHAKVFEFIRALEKKYHFFPTIFADLQGPKLRVGTFENDKILLNAGDVFVLDSDKTPGNNNRVNFPHPEVLKILQEGNSLRMDDGKLKLEVIEVGAGYVKAKVLVGGPLSNRKGVNIPGVKLPIQTLTPKDLKDLEFALNLGADWIVLSFAQCAEDIEYAKSLIKGRAKVITKIENPIAVQCLESMVLASDGVMVARGDLGVEMESEELPSVQRQIIRIARRLGRPVVVATQMLESMISSHIPTRAEVSDVATAIYLGADAVMLSAETASGKYPFETVEIMRKVIEKTEVDPFRINAAEIEDIVPHESLTDAICAAAKNAADFSCANAIMLFSDSFETVVRCSRLRPKAPIVFVTNSYQLAAQSGLCSGVYAVVAPKESCHEEINRAAIAVAREYKFADAGDNIVVIDDIFETSVTISHLA